MYFQFRKSAFRGITPRETQRRLSENDFRTRPIRRSGSSPCSPLNERSSVFVEHRRHLGLLKSLFEFFRTMRDRLRSLGLGDRNHPKEIEPVAINFEISKALGLEIGRQKEIRGQQCCCTATEAIDA